MKKRILVTGGTGFLGSYIVQKLLEDLNNEVSILDVKEFGETKNDHSKVYSYIADIRDREKITPLFLGMDHVFHIAGNIRTPETDRADLHSSINDIGTSNVLEACVKNDVKHLIYTSTCEVYGKVGHAIDEHAKIILENDYAKTKYSGEISCRDYTKKYGLKTTIARLAYIYGHGQYENRLFPKLLNASLKASGKYIEMSPSPGGYDFIYVKDAARGLIHLASITPNLGSEIFNIGSDSFRTYRELFDIIAKLTKCKYKENKDSKSSTQSVFFLSNEKIYKTGFKLDYDLYSGLQDYLKVLNQT